MVLDQRGRARKRRDRPTVVGAFDAPGVPQSPSAGSDADIECSPRVDQETLTTTRRHRSAITHASPVGSSSKEGATDAAVAAAVGAPSVPSTPVVSATTPTPSDIDNDTPSHQRNRRRSSKHSRDQDDITNDDDNDTISTAPTTRLNAPEIIRENKRQRYQIDIVLLLLLTLLALATRFYNLAHPAEIVFDEQHFGKFISAYLTGEYFFDIHPPLGKLMIAGVAKLAGYDGSFEFEAIGVPFPESVPHVALRALPALFGALLVPMAYLTGRFMRMSPTAAATVAWFVLCDTAFLIESRYLLTDAILFFFDCAILGGSFAIVESTPYSISWFVALVLTGISLGSAMSIKFTAMGLVGTVAVHQLFSLLSRYSELHTAHKQARLALLKKPKAAPSRATETTTTTTTTKATNATKATTPSARSNDSVPGMSPEATILVDALVRGTILVGIMLFIMYASWVVHMVLLPYSGAGDIFHTPEFLHSLQRKDGSGPARELPAGKQPMTLHERIFGELIPVMHSVNMGLQTKHPFASYWYSWPLAQFRAVLYWQQVTKGIGMWIWLVGNPVVWASAFVIGIVGSVVLAAVGATYVAAASRSARRRSFSEQRTMEMLARQLGSNSSAIAVLLIGYLGNLVPYVLVPRETWNYHYLPALLYAVLLLGLVLDVLLKASHGSVTLHATTKLLLVALVCSAGVLFAYLSPWVYAFPMTQAQTDARMLFKAWSDWRTVD